MVLKLCCGYCNKEDIVDMEFDILTSLEWGTSWSCSHSGEMPLKLSLKMSWSTLTGPHQTLPSQAAMRHQLQLPVSQEQSTICLYYHH